MAARFNVCTALLEDYGNLISALVGLIVSTCIVRGASRRSQSLHHDHDHDFCVYLFPDLKRIQIITVFSEIVLR